MLTVYIFLGWPSAFKRGIIIVPEIAIQYVVTKVQKKTFDLSGTIEIILHSAPIGYSVSNRFWRGSDLN